MKIAEERRGEETGKDEKRGECRKGEDKGTEERRGEQCRGKRKVYYVMHYFQ